MEHSHARAALPPQWYADQLGWYEIVRETAVIWNQLRPNQRPDCGIFAQGYGQAGAIDFLGRGYGLPASLSGHQTWFLWGPRQYSGDCLIVLDDRRENLERLWKQVDYDGRSADNPYALEKNIDVYICRRRRFSSLVSGTLAKPEALALGGARSGRFSGEEERQLIAYMLRAGFLSGLGFQLGDREAKPKHRAVS